MTIEQIFEKIEQMSFVDLSRLICESLDNAEVEYTKGKSDINFGGLEKEISDD